MIFLKCKKIYLFFAHQITQKHLQCFFFVIIFLRFLLLMDGTVESIESLGSRERGRIAIEPRRESNWGREHQSACVDASTTTPIVELLTFKDLFYVHV